MENQQQQPVFNTQVALPNATAVLVLGIVSIVSCCCYGVPGIICGIIALVLGKKDLQLFTSAPGVYTEASYKNLKAGRTCAIIGLSLSIVYFIAVIAMIALYGTMILSNPALLKEMGRHQY